MASSLKFACVVLMCMALVGAPMVQALTCGQVASGVAPCATYISKGGAPPAACCAGLKGILDAAKTTADLQATCSCLKSAAASNPGFNYNNADALSGKCGVNIPYKITASTNCAALKF